MRRFSFVLLLVAALALFSGCASDGILVNPFADNTPPPVNPYYYDEFPDLPIPNEMTEVASDTVITSTASGVRTGIQHFQGRVESVSLINAMRKNMANQGWTLRSLFRAQQTIMIYEKTDRVCSLYITDGMIYTDMRVFVSQRLEGDSSDLDVNQYSIPVTTSNAGSKTVLAE